MNNNIRASKKINSELYKVEYWINLWKGLTYKNNYPRNVIISFKMLEYLMLSTEVLQRRPLPHYYFFVVFSGHCQWCSIDYSALCHVQAQCVGPFGDGQGTGYIQHSHTNDVRHKCCNVYRYSCYGNSWSSKTWKVSPTKPYGCTVYSPRAQK